MSGLLSSPKPVRAPTPTPTPPIPTVGEEVGEQARKKRPRGRQEAFLTGNLIPDQDLGKLRLG